MIKLSQKCIYSLRAIFELCLHNSPEPLKVEEIAKAQKIPKRFLEIILLELKNGGFISSKRGIDGGYLLSKSPTEIRAGEIIEYIQGFKKSRGKEFKGDTIGNYVFSKMLQAANRSLEAIFNKRSFAALVDEEITHRNENTPNYVI